MGRGFKGEYNHTVDAKGRLIVPAKFREALGETFVVTKGLDGCLFLYPNEEWAIIVEIWSKERWLGENEYEDMDEAAEHMSALGLSI